MTPVPRYEEARRQSGEPYRREDVVAGSPGKTSDIEARIIALEALTTADLRIEWRRLYRATPPTRLSCDLSIRGVAYRLQEQIPQPATDTRDGDRWDFGTPLGASLRTGWCV